MTRRTTLKSRGSPARCRQASGDGAAAGSSRDGKAPTGVTGGETRGSYLPPCQEARAAENQFALGAFEGYIPA